MFAFILPGEEEKEGKNNPQILTGISKKNHTENRLRPTTYLSPVSTLSTLHFQLPLALHLACDKKVKH